jgi:hypothetical protein
MRTIQRWLVAALLVASGIALAPAAGATNRVGRAWRVRIRHNGVLIFVGKRVTKAPSGAFTVRLLTNNRAGTDSFRAGARAVVSGQTCVGRASIG